MGKLAISGGVPIRTKNYPVWPQVDQKDINAVSDVVKSGKWWMFAYEYDPAAGNIGSGRSKDVELEDTFKQMQHADNAIAVSNGTVALDIACKVAGLKPGDEVITTPYTFVASSSCVLNSMAIPVYVDIKPENLTINPDLIEDAITERTKAILPVHFGGAFCDMDKINRIAKKHNLLVIEDSAHMPGASLKKHRFAGTLGDIGIFSFQNSKILTCGEGGMITTNDEKMAEMCWSMRHMGRSKYGGWYETIMVGTNSRMTELQAALLLSQMEKFDRQNMIRRRNGRKFFEDISNIQGIDPPEYHPDTENDIYYLACLRYNKEEWDGIPRDNVIKALKAEGIPVSGGYEYPLYKNPVFQTLDFDSTSSPYSIGRKRQVTKYSEYEKRCPVAEHVTKEGAIWLANELFLGSENDTRDIYRAFEKVYENREEIKDL